MTRARTLWEEGHQPGRQLVVLGVASLLTFTVLDRAGSGRLGLLFDLGFVVVCLGLALAVRHRDFFTVGVLPPLLMLGVVALLALTSPGSLASPDDNLVQTVVTGLATHAGALVTGYALCLVVLAIRHRVLTRVAPPTRAPRTELASADR